MKVIHLRESEKTEKTENEKLVKLGIDPNKDPEDYLDDVLDFFGESLKEDLDEEIDDSTLAKAKRARLQYTKTI